MALEMATLAYPSPPLPLNFTNGWTGPLISRRQNSNLPDLCILPLGASITYGFESTDGNGYWKYLRDQLRFIGYEVNMVGSQRPKGMNNNDNKGHSRFTVQQVHGMVKPQYHIKPNLVLINAGTNDYWIKDINAERDSAGWMEEMVIDIFNNIPEVTVILSGLLPNRAFDDCNKALNDQYNALINKLAGQGRKFTFEDLINGTHPNNFGYKKMASVWYDAFQRAVVQEFITPPLDNGLLEGATTAVCDKHPGEYEFSAQTQQGSRADDGPYKHEGISQGYAFTVSLIHENLLGKTIFWADLDGDGCNKLIWYYNPIKAKGYYMVYFNWENGDNTAWTVINVNNMCNPEGVHWGDVDANGLDDFICIGKVGNMYVSLNKGGVIPQFQYHGLYHKNPRPSDTSQANVWLGDMDGDSRLDYCLVLGNGDIYY
ncbi:SGNH hydrolase-type esterase domain-containing protein [Aspergillus insuetus]